MAWKMLKEELERENGWEGSKFECLKPLYLDALKDSGAWRLTFSGGISRSERRGRT